MLTFSLVSNPITPSGPLVLGFETISPVRVSLPDVVVYQMYPNYGYNKDEGRKAKQRGRDLASQEEKSRA